MKQSDKRARTREALIREAVRAFARDGYAATTLDAVAAGAGYSKGALFAHFASKLELFLEAADAALSDARRRTEAVALAVEGGRPPLAAAARYLGSEDDSEHVRMLVCLWSEALREHSVHERLARYARWRVVLLSASLRHPGTLGGPTSSQVAALAALVDGAVAERARAEAGRGRELAA